MSIVFETPRLIFRQFTEEDAPFILSLNSDPEVIKYVHEPLVETEEQAKEIITNIILPQYKNKLGRWALHTKDNNEFIGWCGLKHRNEKDKIDLGYRLKRSAWGKGFATEAAKHTLEHGFKLQLKQITATAHIENIASINVLKKIGMTLITEGFEDDCLVKVYTFDNPYL